MNKLCLCGCGQEVSVKGNRFINHHQRRGIRYRNINFPKIILCNCGCGQEFEEYSKHGHKRKFANGHNARTQIFWDRKVNETMQCLCGCGKKVSNKKHWFIHGHNAVTRGWEYQLKLGLIQLPMCSCGCGEKVSNPKRKYIWGHNGRGISFSLEIKKKYSECKLGEKNPLFGTKASEETREKMSNSQKEHWQNNNNRKNKLCERMKGNQYTVGKPCWNKGLCSYIDPRIPSKEKHSLWNGGSSFEPYCFEWDKWLKNQIKERDNFECKNPNCHSTTKLCVHHIDYNKKNCSSNNLITLCNSCNSKANYNREYWKELYYDLMERK